MAKFSPSILLIGAGKMGGALLASWIRAGVPAANITVVDPHAKEQPQGVNVVSALAHVTSKHDCVLLAVKPQTMDALMREVAEKYAGNTRTMFLSVAAGKTLAYFNRLLPGASIVRAMPNTPALIGKGVSALVANNNATEAHKQLAEKLLATAGETVWLQNEGQMDAVTALSGSGPAYMFLFLDMLVDAAKAQGLPEEISKKLALQTMLGSAELAQQSPETLSQLRKNVTSPGGTTEAALGVFMKNDALKSLVHKAVWQAVKRSKELA